MANNIKNGILIVPGSTNSPMKNIGDYIQSYAALQFIKNSENVVFIDKENINTADIIYSNDDIIKVIMNGWWMFNPKNFPPSNNIMPLYISFHLTPSVSDVFFSSSTIAHLKKYEPIGCRDENTVILMKNHGINAYFSGCLTLTLGFTFRHHYNEKSKIFIVDLFVGKMSYTNIKIAFPLLMRRMGAVIFNSRRLLRIAKQIRNTSRNHKTFLKSFAHATKIYAVYSSAVDESVLYTAIYEEHSVKRELFPTEKDRIVLARNLLENYSEAKYVITSRIHCALPCLGMGTPVIFISSSKIMNSGRLGGLYDFFRKGFVDKGRCTLNKVDFPNVDKIDVNYSFENYSKHLKYCENLTKKAKEFYL